MGTDFILAQEELEEAEKFEVIPIPLLELSAPTSQILVGDTLQLRLVGMFPNGVVQDLTASSTGTTYQSSSLSIASVSLEGGVFAVAPGSVTVSASNDGFVASMRLKVIDPNDRDGDLLPDTYEAANGLDPTDPSDALLDTDGDFLVNRDEFQRGTNPQSADTDGDDISDGEEVLFLGLDPLVFSPQPDGTCVAAVLNRSVRVDPSGAIFIPNVPGTGGVERISVTCEREGVTLAGQSAFFRVIPGAVLEVPSITLGVVEPIPERLEVTATETVLTAIGATTQLTVTGHFADGTSRDLTSESSGTTYVSSNPGVAVVESSPGGLVRAVGSGTALIAVRNQGVLTVIAIRVELGSDADQDGLPDDFEASRSCLDASVADAAADPDGDGLTNISEFDGTGVAGFSGGTEPCVADTDGDGLGDGVEAGGVSSPVLADTDLDDLIDGAEPVGDFDGDGAANIADPDSDNDGLPDGLEVRICGTPFCADPLADNDGDGLRNIDEAGLFTDPLDADSDDDGLTDGEEAVQGTDPLVPDRTPPTVTLVAPAPGTNLVEDERLTVRAGATDEGRVTRVDFRVDGNVVATATAEPFEATFIVPIDVSSLSIEATVFDTNANSATTGPIQFTVIPDPLTIVEGVVLDEASAPVEGARATVRLPDVRVETGAMDATGGAVEPVPDSPLRSSSLAGEVLFDAGILALLGDAADLEPAGPLTLNGTLALDFTGFNASSPTSRRGTLTLSGSAPTGLSVSMQGEVEDFLPVAGEQAFTVDLTVTAFDPASVATAFPLAGRSLKAHLQGGIQVSLDPVSGQVTSLTVTGGLELSADLDFSATSDLNGVFSIPGVPTIFGDIVVDAEKREAGGLLRRGSSAATPFIRGGFTDVGGITLHLLPRARRDYPVGGSNPLSMAVGDVNGDGRPDVVTGNAVSNNVSVLLANPGGTYQAARVFGGVGNRPRAVGIADFDGDGAPDLAVANENSSNVTILLGNETGSFQALQSFTVGATPFSLAVADLNGDTFQDVVTANFNSGGVSVLLGRGDGTFNPASAFATGSAANAVAIADLNNDTILDLAVANRNANTVSALLGNGNGTFQSAQNFGTGTRPEALAVADLNGDGARDLVVVNAADNNVSILLGNGNGTFQSRQNFGVGLAPFDVSVGHLNGDAAPDLVVSNPSSMTVSVLLGAGTGSFTSAPALSAPPSTFATEIVDANGDGKQDLLTSFGLNTNAVGVWYGLGDGTFEANRAFMAEDRPRALDVGDVNGDGRLDVVILSETSTRVSAFLGTGDGTFQPRINSIIRSGTGIELADIDEDGRLDLALADFLGISGFIFVSRGNGDGTFTQFSNTIFAAGDRPAEVALGDLDGDGFLDMAAVNRDGNNLSVRLGNGDLTFGPLTNYPVGTTPLDVAIADLDGDGDNDVVVTNNGSNTVSVLLGVGDGTLMPAQHFAAGARPFNLTLGDFDRDGIPDVAVGNETIDRVSVLFGQGDCTLGDRIERVTADEPRSVTAADFNGDGLLDVAVANDLSNNVAVLLGRGDGTFRAATFFGTQDRPIAIRAGDFNGDGIPDIAVVNFDSDQLSVLIGRGDGTF